MMRRPLGYTLSDGCLARPAGLEDKRGMTTVHEMRRNAFHHYRARAGNARVCAWTLAHAGERMDGPPDLSPNIATGVAWHEGFLREAAIAIELLLKSAICLRIEAGDRTLPVPLTHNLPQLWTEAGLRKPNDARTRHDLETLRVVLAWSGRYPTAPNADKEASDVRAIHADMEHFELGSLKVYRARPLRWAEFEALYSTIEVKIGALFEASPRRF